MVLPIVITCQIIRRKISRYNTMKDIVLAALEKNADIDVQELV